MKTAVLQPGVIAARATVPLQAATVAQPLDTPQTSTIADAVGFSPGVVVLLGEGRRCGCGVVFASRDSGRSWSALRGPDRVTAADRLAVQRGGAGIEVYVLRADGSTFSSPDLSAIAQGA
jgi:hypothetical protein